MLNLSWHTAVLLDFPPMPAAKLKRNYRYMQWPNEVLQYNNSSLFLFSVLYSVTYPSKKFPWFALSV